MKSNSIMTNAGTRLYLRRLPGGGILRRLHPLQTGRAQHHEARVPRFNYIGSFQEEALLPYCCGHGGAASVDCGKLPTGIWTVTFAFCSASHRTSVCFGPESIFEEISSIIRKIARICDANICSLNLAIPGLHRSQRSMTTTRYRCQ